MYSHRFGNLNISVKPGTQRMSKGYCSPSCQIVILLTILTLFTQGRTDDIAEGNIGKIRQKRNLICLFGLTGLVKRVVYSALEDVHQNDPLRIGDTSDGKLKDGIFYGLSTLTNLTEMNVQCDGSRVLLNTTLGITDAMIFYKWHRKYLFKFDGTIWTKADNVQFDVEVAVNFDEEITLDVTSTLVTKLDGFKFGFSGLGPLNPIVKGYVKGLHKLWSKKVTKRIERLIKRSLESQFKKMTF